MLLLVCHKPDAWPGFSALRQEQVPGPTSSVVTSSSRQRSHNQMLTPACGYAILLCMGEIPTLHTFKNDCFRNRLRHQAKPGDD